jgi:hypothetical protein
MGFAPRGAPFHTKLLLAGGATEPVMHFDLRVVIRDC